MMTVCPLLLALSAASAEPWDGLPSTQTPATVGIRQLPIVAKSHPDPSVLERSFLLPGLHDLIFEAQIAPHIFLYDNFHRLYEAPRPPDKRLFALAVSFTPMLRVRIQDVASGPIKTLSWMPKGDAQLVWLRRYPRAPEKPPRAGAWTLLATVGHHSNGQDECTYVPGVLSREDLCPHPDRVADVRINYPNGSFSTNYARLGVFKEWLTLADVGDHSFPVRTLQLGGAFEVNPSGLKIGGTLPPVLRELYGCNRLLGRAEWETRIGSLTSTERSGLLRGSLRLTGSVEYLDKVAPSGSPTFTSVPDAPMNALYDPKTGASRWRLSAEIAWNPDALRGWGLVARYVHGQDYYNVLFFRDVHWFQAGIVFDPGELQIFGK